MLMSKTISVSLISSLAISFLLTDCPAPASTIGGVAHPTTVNLSIGPPPIDSDASLVNQANASFFLGDFEKAGK